MNADSSFRSDPYRPEAYPVLAYDESVWTKRGTWGSIVIGALVGFAITVTLGTFGAATGISVGAAAAEKHDGRSVDRTANDHAANDRVLPNDRAVDRDTSRAESAPAATVPVRTTQDEREAMKGAAVGGALWMVLTALVVGIIGGSIAGRIAQVHTSDIPIVGLATWAVGILVLVGLSAFGASGLMGGVGAGTGEALSNRGVDVDVETAKAAAAAAGIAMWGFFVAQLVGLVATIMGAKAGMKRRMRLTPIRTDNLRTVPVTPINPVTP